MCQLSAVLIVVVVVVFCVAAVVAAAVRAIPVVANTGPFRSPLRRRRRHVNQHDEGLGRRLGGQEAEGR